MKENRSVKNIFVRPRQQLRLLLSVFGVATALYTCFIVFYFTSLMSTLTEFASAYGFSDEASAMLAQSLTRSAFSIALVGCAVVLLMVAMAVRLSHRIYGPMAPLEAHVRRLRNGDYKARGVLRKGDEFKPLMQELNLLAEDLERRANGSAGFSLVEVLVVCAIIGIVALAMTSLFETQTKMMSGIEFRGKKEQIRQALIGQVLSDPNNCACLFKGATEFPDNPAAPGATLTGVTPTAIGTYHFVTAGNCATATLPAPLVSSTGVDGVIATSITLMNIMEASTGVYTGSLQVGLQSMKSVLGPSNLKPIDIPVSVATTPGSPGHVVFKSCSMAAVSAPTGAATFLKTTCGWVSGSCTPPACPSGYTDAGVISNEILTMDKPYDGGRNTRYCYVGSGHQIEISCSTNGGSCLPAPCPAGFTQLGNVSSEVTANSKPYVGWNYIRTCIN